MVSFRKRMRRLLPLLFLYVLFGCCGNVYGDRIEEKDFGFETDRILKGVYVGENLYFQIPDYWEIQDAQAEIFLEVSPMLLDVPASLTFSLNDVPLESVDLDYTGGQQQELTVEIPGDKLQEGFNRFSVTGFARIYDEEGCLDEFSGANWVVIQKESCVNIRYEMKTPSCQVAEYPYPLISSANENGEGVTVFVSDQASDQELTAAAWIRAGLSQQISEKDEIKLKYYSSRQEDSSYVLSKMYDFLDDMSEEDRDDRDKLNKLKEIMGYDAENWEDTNFVLVALYDHLDESFRKDLKDMGVDRNRLDSAAVIAMQEMAEGGYQVLVVSDKGECLSEAAQLLMDESRLSQETSSVAYVPEGSDALLKEGREKGEAREIALRDWIGSDGMELRGSFRQSGTVYPAGGIAYVLGTQDVINLKFRYSDNLDFRRSLLTVYVNGKPAGSKKLSTEHAGGDLLELTVPEDMAGEVLDSITFSFDLEIEELYCTTRLDEMPWAYISGDSVITLAGLQNQFLSFEVAPWPFVRCGYGESLVFVIPDDPSEAEFNTFGMLVSLYGRSMEPYGDLEVLRESEVNEETTADAQMILCGTFRNLSLLNDVQDSLPFPVDAEKNRFVGNDVFAFSEAYASSVAAMQLIPSCYNNTRAMLEVTAPDDENLAQLSEYLSDLEKREELEGDTVLVDSNLEMRSFIFQNDKEEVEKPGLRERLVKNKTSVLFALTATSSVFLLLIASVLILIRAHSIRKKEGQ